MGRYDYRLAQKGTARGSATAAHGRVRFAVRCGGEASRQYSPVVGCVANTRPTNVCQRPDTHAHHRLIEQAIRFIVMPQERLTRVAVGPDRSRIHGPRLRHARLGFGVQPRARTRPVRV